MWYDRKRQKDKKKYLQPQKSEKLTGSSFIVSQSAAREASSRVINAQKKCVWGVKLLKEADEKSDRVNTRHRTFTPASRSARLAKSRPETSDGRVWDVRGPGLLTSDFK